MAYKIIFFQKVFNNFLNINTMKQKGFTLIELLVVVAIIGILASVGVVAYSGYTEISKEKVCLNNFTSLKKIINQNWTMCDIEDKVSLKTMYWKGVEGTARDVKCSNFGTIAGETVKHFTNYATSPYENLHNNLDIMSYIGDPPNDGQISYYPESKGFKLRVKCRGKVTYYQLPVSKYP